MPLRAGELGYVAKLATEVKGWSRVQHRKGIKNCGALNGDAIAICSKLCPTDLLYGAALDEVMERARRRTAAMK